VPNRVVLRRVRSVSCRAAQLDIYRLLARSIAKPSLKSARLARFQLYNITPGPKKRLGPVQASHILLETRDLSD
jgi:hypothetical protein